MKLTIKSGKVEITNWKDRSDILDTVVSLYPSYKYGDSLRLDIEDVLAIQSLMTLQMTTGSYPSPHLYPDDMVEMAYVIQFMIVEDVEKVTFCAEWGEV